MFSFFIIDFKAELLKLSKLDVRLFLFSEAKCQNVIGPILETVGCSKVGTNCRFFSSSLPYLLTNSLTRKADV